MRLKRANSFERIRGTRGAMTSRMATIDLKHLSNDQLVTRLQHACLQVNVTNLEIMRMLIETDERRVYLEDACSSMFDFCLRRLKMSEGAAYLRLACARLVRDFPTLAPRIQSGDLTLSALVRLRRHLTAENVEELADAVRGMSKRRIMEFLAARNPGVPAPPEPARLRKLPKMRKANAVVPTLERELEIVADMQYRLGLTLDRAERDELFYVRDLMMHRNPSGDLKAVFMAAIRAMREPLEREIHGATKRPRKTPSIAKADAIPRETRRIVVARDGHRCSYTNKKGDRCPATAPLQFHHLISPHHGGTNDPDNVTLRCGPHNRWHAEQDFGKEYVRAKIRSSQLKSRRKREAIA